MGFFLTSQLNRSLVNKIPQCGACGLYKTCKSPKMQPTGDGTHKILFVGEAPGETEDANNTQLVGKAGQCLRGMLPIDLDEAWKTNAVICRPPENKIEDAYIEHCRPNLTNTIAALKPNVIVLLGKSAVTSLIGPEWGGDVGELTRWVGWAIPSPTYNAWLCPTYHPSYVLRTNEDPALVKITRAHLRRAVGLEHTPVPKYSIKELEKQVEVITTPLMMRTRLEWLAEQSGYLGVDYETSGLKPEDPKQFIYSGAFCLGGKTTFSGLLDESCYPALRRVLLNPKLRKIASNLKFEERWSICKVGTHVEGWWWDTMLSAHIADNREGITSIKFQSYINLGIGDYSSPLKPYWVVQPNGLNRVREAPVREFLLYGSLDALLEYRVAMLQKERAMWT